MLTATFKDWTFHNVRGYLLYFAFTPGQGFRGFCGVKLICAVDHSASLPDVQAYGPRNARPAGAATLAGEDRDYEWESISLKSVTSGCTRSERVRIVTLEYAPPITDKQNIPATFAFQGGRLLDEDPADYTYSLSAGDGGGSEGDGGGDSGGGSEPLLAGFVRKSASARVGLHLMALRNQSNSFVDKVVEMSKQQATGQGNKFEPFEVEFSHGNIPVSPESLHRLFVVEAFGDCVEHLDLSLDRVFEANCDPRLLVPSLGEPPVFKALAHDQGEFDERPGAGDTVESAIFVFNRGYCKDLVLP